MKTVAKQSQVIVNNRNKKFNTNTNEKVSFADLDHDISQARLSKELGKWSALKEKALNQKKDAFFHNFLDGKARISGKNADDMRRVLYECADRYNDYHYKLALSGRMTFLNAAKDASKVFQKINGKGITRDALVAILTKFYRFYHIINAHDTFDELFIFSNTKHIYVPIKNKLDNLCYALYSGFGYGLLKLHAIVRLIENDKFTRTMDIDSQKYQQFLQRRKNWVICNNCIYDRAAEKTMRLSPKYFITSKLSINYVKGDTLAKIADTKIKDAIHYTKRDASLYHCNGILMNQSISQYLELWLNGEANGNKGTERQLLQEILDAFEPYFSHESLVLNYGSTRTGKSNFFIPIKTMLGLSQYASMSIDNLDKSKVLSTLVGKSVMLGDDLKANLHIKDGTNLTKIVRGGNVYVEAKYKQGRSTVFYIAMLQNTNTLPKTAGKGDWILNRITIVHFKHHYSKKDPLYLNDDIMKRILSNPLFCEVLLHKVLTQPPFSRYVQTPESNHLRNVFAYQNNPVKLFTMKILQAHKNRLVKHILYQQYIQFARRNGYNYRINASHFDTLFKECVSNVEVHQERMNNIQCLNQELITHQFNLKTTKVNADGRPYDKPLIDKPMVNKRYSCYVFPDIPKNIINCDVDGTIFNVLPNDGIRFLKTTEFKPGEHDYDAKVLYQNKLLSSKDGIKLANLINDIKKYGYQGMCKHRHLNAKQEHLRLLKVAAFTRYNHKSYLEYYNSADDSTYADLQFHIKNGFAEEKQAKALKVEQDKEAPANSEDMAKIKSDLNKSDTKDVKPKHSKKAKSTQNKLTKKPVKVHDKLDSLTDNGSTVVDEHGIEWSINKREDIVKVRKDLKKLYIANIQFKMNKAIALTDTDIKLTYKAPNNKDKNKLSFKSYWKLLRIYDVNG